MSNKVILCAIDFSNSSLQALKWALDLASYCKAQVTVLFCYRLIVTEENGDSELLDLKRNMEMEALDKFKEFEKELSPSQKVSCQFITEVGFISTRIEAFIRKSPVSLVVMGDSIIDNFNEYKNLNFDQFLHNSKVSIVVVPEGAKEKL